jgi:hypothetical protein
MGDMLGEQRDGWRDEVDTLMAQTLWSEPLVRALTELRERHPEARLEIAALEYALTNAARGIRSYLTNEQLVDRIEGLYMPASPSSSPQVGMDGPTDGLRRG